MFGLYRRLAVPLALCPKHTWVPGCPAPDTELCGSRQSLASKVPWFPFLLPRLPGLLALGSRAAWRGRGGVPESLPLGFASLALPTRCRRSSPSAESLAHGASSPRGGARSRQRQVWDSEVPGPRVRRPSPARPRLLGE